jgi:uncharacterized protein (TIGR03437 family)
MFLRTLYLFLVVELLWGQSAVLTPVTFSDDSFSVPWRSTRIGSTEGTAQGSQSAVLAGGNPGAWGLVTVDFRPRTTGGSYPDYEVRNVAGTAWFFFTKPNFIHTPGSAAAVLAVDYQEDFLHANSSCASCPESITSMPAIRQNGVVFVARRRNWTQAGGWQRYEQLRIPIGEFTEFGRTGGASVNVGPNAPLLELGFVRGFASSDPLALETGVDNWRMTLRRQGEWTLTNDRYAIPVEAGREINISANVGLLSNDLVPTGARVVVTRRPLGTLRASENGSFSYQPPPTGNQDFFYYRVEMPGFESVEAQVVLDLERRSLQCAISLREMGVSNGLSDGRLVNFRSTYEVRVLDPAGGPFLPNMVVSVQLLDANGRVFGEEQTGSTGTGGIASFNYFEDSRMRGVGARMAGITSGCAMPLNPLRASAPRVSATALNYRPNDVGCVMMGVLAFVGTYGEIGERESSSQDLPTRMRQYRDEVLSRDERLRTYKELYYRHTAEVRQLLLARPQMALEAAQLLFDLAGAAGQVLAKQPLEDSAGLEAHLQAMLEKLKPLASPALRADLEQLQRDLKVEGIRTALGLPMAGEDLVAASVRDAAGNVFLAGSNRRDAFVKKLEAGTGKQLFARYFGGNRLDAALGLALDRRGNVVVTGVTSSADFPVLGAVQATYGGDGTSAFLSGDAFVMVLEPAEGKSLFSTFLGGEEFDAARGVAVDSQGMIYVAGVTRSKNFPVRGGLGGQFNGPSDGWVAKLDVSTRSIVYSSYLGGAGEDAVAQIAVNAAGEVVIAGATTGRGFPLQNPQQALPGGLGDAFVAQLNAAGDRLLYSTYFGDSGDEVATSLALGSDGKVLVGGSRIVGYEYMGWLAEFDPRGKLLRAQRLEGEGEGIPLDLKPGAAGLDVAGIRLGEGFRVSPYLSTRKSDWTAAESNPSVYANLDGVAMTQSRGQKGEREVGGFVRGLSADGKDDLKGFFAPLPAQANPGSPGSPGSPGNTVRLRRASSRGLAEAMSPGGLFVLSGLALRDGVPAVADDASQPPEELGGYRLRVGSSAAAALHSVSTTEIVFVAPLELPTSEVEISLERGGTVIWRSTVWVESNIVQLFSSNGRNGGPALAEWVNSEDAGVGPGLRVYASGLSTSATASIQLLFCFPGETVAIPLVERSAVGGYLGLESLRTGSLPVNVVEALRGNGGVRVYLEDNKRLSNEVSLRLP